MYQRASRRPKWSAIQPAARPPKNEAMPETGPSQKPASPLVSPWTRRRKVAFQVLAPKPANTCRVAASVSHTNARRCHR